MMERRAVHRLLTCVAIALLAAAPHTAEGQVRGARGRGTAAVINVPAAPGGGPNTLANPGINTIASDVHTATISGGGRTGYTTGTTGIGNIIIGGRAASNASYATVGGGYDNRNDMLAGTIAGGAHHFLDSTNGGDHGFIGGGSLNTISASGPYNAIAGGTGNVISGTAQRAFIGAGQTNTASAPGIVIGGGSNNSSAGDSSFIGGGSTSTVDANGLAATIGGGSQNQITGVGATYGTISGGTQNQITAAAYGSIGGGLANVVSANYGRVGGGQSNTASGQYTFIGGGSGNIASGTRAIILGGATNTASIESAAVINGQQNSAAGSYCTVRGLRGACTEYGQHTSASGWFAAVGDAQAFEVVQRAITTTATVTDLSLDGAGTRVGIPDNTNYVFDVLVIARRTDAVDPGVSAFRVVGAMKRDVGAATTTVSGVTTTTIASMTNVTGTAATAVADTTNGRISIRVTGGTGATIRWVAHGRFVSVTQ